MATGSKRRRKKSGGSLGRVAEAAAKQGKGKAQFLKLDDGEVAVVRVLDTGDDFEDCYCHRVQMEREDGSSYYADVPCLDQDEKGLPCPGCKEDLRRSYKFWTNVIVRGDEDADEKEAQKDRIMIWSSGITIAKRLDKLDARHGLENRDIEVEREGSTMKNTKYEIEWATDENEPLTDEDLELAKQKYDLKRYSKIPEFDDFFVPPGQREGNDDDDPGEASLKRGSGFKARKRKGKSDDDDDEPKRTTTRRRKSSTSSKPALKGFGGKESSSKSSSTKTTVRRRRSR